MDEIVFQKIKAKLLDGINTEGCQVKASDNVETTTYEKEVRLKNFMKFLAEKNLAVNGSIQGFHDPVTFICMDCDITFEATPIECWKTGCFECKEQKRNLQKDLVLWEKSIKVINGKNGQIVRYSENDQDTAPTVNDRFFVKCQNNHTFTTTHKYLLRGRWCRFCEPVEKSACESVIFYKKRLTAIEKQRRLFEICQIKGCKLRTNANVDGEYELMCIQCGKYFRKTRRQILAAIYLCPDRCIKSKKIIVSELA